MGIKLCAVHRRWCLHNIMCSAYKGASPSQGENLALVPNCAKFEAVVSKVANPVDVQDDKGVTALYAVKLN